MENITKYVETICANAKKAAPSLAKLSTHQKNKALAYNLNFYKKGV